jgi:hypothetical protein
MGKQYSQEPVQADKSVAQPATCLAALRPLRCVPLRLAAGATTNMASVARR